jgi:hypothetical protein
MATDEWVSFNVLLMEHQYQRGRKEGGGGGGEKEKEEKTPSRQLVRIMQGRTIEGIVQSIKIKSIRYQATAV